MPTPTFFVLQPEQISKLLQQPSVRYPTGQRNRLLIETILKTGLRLSEVIHLEWKDISLDEMTIDIDGESGPEQRVVSFNSSLVESFNVWKDTQSARLGNSTLVFTTLNGGGLKPQYIRDMIMRYAKKAGIEHNVNPSVLRHTFALHYYQKTEDIEQVQEALGHQHLQSTMVYKSLFDSQ